jgi:protein-tyrosine sulfotransferase
MTQSSEPVEQPVSVAPGQLADGPLFVVGMFRSGTSLLYALLNQHPQIALMYEGDLAHLPSLFWFPTDTRQWLAKWNFWNGAVSRHKIDVVGIPPGVSDLQTAVREAYTAYARRKKGATIWGCKSPTYSDELTRLGRTFPNARFVIIWRDLRSICHSIVKAAAKPSYFRRVGMMTRVLIGYHELKVQSDKLIADGIPVHSIYYEDMVRDPADTMRGICEFLQIPFDPKMSSLEGADRSVIEEAPHHSRVKGKKIESSKKSLKDLPPALKNKIDRYLFMWRQKYNDAWPLYPQLVEGAAGPSLWERFRDRLEYRGLQVWYHTTPIVFSFVPESLWKQYRKFRVRPYAADPFYELGDEKSQDQTLVSARSEDSA